MIKSRNASLDDYCNKLINIYAQSDVHATILKGQGVATYYDEHICSFRQSGDIDIYAPGGRKKNICLAKLLGKKEVDWDYQHLHLVLWENVEIEVHYKVEVSFNLIRNYKLQKWFVDNSNLLYDSCEKNFTMPSVSLNLFYILLYLHRHFFTEGVGLRQLMDYYYVLKKANGHFEQYADGKNISQTIRDFGLSSFTSGLMWVLQRVFGLEPRLMYCTPDEREGQFILSEVMRGGNFGHFDDRLKHQSGKIIVLWNMIKHNIRYLTRYPSDAMWASIWLFYHKLWKISRVVF